MTCILALVTVLLIVVVLLLIYIVTILNHINMTQTELAAALDAANTKLEKVIAEVKTLKTAYENSGQTIPEVDASLGRLQANLQIADDVNEDTSTEG